MIKDRADVAVMEASHGPNLGVEAIAEPLKPLGGKVKDLYSDGITMAPMGRLPDLRHSASPKTDVQTVGADMDGLNVAQRGIRQDLGDRGPTLSLFGSTEPVNFIRVAWVIPHEALSAAPVRQRNQGQEGHQPNHPRLIARKRPR